MFDSGIISINMPSNLIDSLLPYLPPGIRDVVLDWQHSSALSVISSILPYTKYIIVIAAVYIVWTAVTSVFGIFSRFFRFALRIGPLLAIFAAVMSASGQGDLGDVVKVVKQWTGLAPRNDAIHLPAGLSSLAGLFGADKTAKRSKRASPGSGSQYSTRGGSSSGKRGQNDNNGGFGAEAVANIINSATGLRTEAHDVAAWQDTVQQYVRQAVAKASGSEWLFGDQPKDAKKNWWSW